MPVYYECQRCTACCRWPGQVKLTEAEIDAIASFLDLDVRSFVEDYTRLRPDRSGLALVERSDGDGACVFLQGDACRIQPVKPKQCRDFPNQWRFPGFELVCRAVPRDVSEAEYRRLMGPVSRAS